MLGIYRKGLGYSKVIKRRGWQTKNVVDITVPKHPGGDDDVVDDDDDDNEDSDNDGVRTVMISKSDGFKFKKSKILKCGC